MSGSAAAISGAGSTHGAGSKMSVHGNFLLPPDRRVVYDDAPGIFDAQLDDGCPPPRRRTVPSVELSRLPQLCMTPTRTAFVDARYLEERKCDGSRHPWRSSSRASLRLRRQHRALGIARRAAAGALIRSG